MHIVITGGAGFLGRQLAKTLLDKTSLAATSDAPEVQKLTLFDVVSPQNIPSDSRVEIVTGDIREPQVLASLVTPDVDLIFHLAAVVSGEAEANFELGMQVNLAATQNLLEQCRQLNTRPRLVFTSSVAVFGGDMPAVLQDDTAPTPQSSYGTQKAIGELLINDYSRRGFIDGRAVRLPTIVVRPGRPNKATSTFASSIIREPLQGQPAVCPVSPEMALWIMSPRQAVKSLIHAAALPAEAWGSSRVASLPGLTVSVREMVDQLRVIAGQTVVDRIAWQPDPFIERIVGSWPIRFATPKAEALGFEADKSIDEIIHAFIEEELGGSFVA